MDLVNFVSKAFWFVAQPGNLLLLVILIGTLVAWMRPSKSGRVWLTTLSVLLLFVAFAPIYTWIARPLEDRFPPPASLPARIDGILVLGGFSDARIAHQRGLLAVSESAERIMVSAALARDHPEARLVITGQGEAHQTLSTWLSDMGLDRSRIVYEPRASNTFENAALSYRKLQPGPNEVWLLVTSAQHMPRAVGVSRKIGWPLIPYPVDYQTADIEMFADWPDLAANLAGIGVALKEWIGLVAYYAMDRTDELFPGPFDLSHSG